MDAASDTIYRYANAAGRLSGSQNAASSFALDVNNRDPKDLVTDGTHVWVVNDLALDKVYKYTVAGALVGSWAIDAANANPTGITLDPANPRHLWIVDNGTDRVYQYDNAVSRASGSQAASASFALAAGNTNPQGIADPPAPADASDWVIDLREPGLAFPAPQREAGGVTVRPAPEHAEDRRPDVVRFADELPREAPPPATGRDHPATRWRRTGLPPTGSTTLPPALSHPAAARSGRDP